MKGRPYEISECHKLRQEFRRVFNLDFAEYYDKVLTLFVYKRWVLDLFKFEKKLRVRFPKEDENASIKDIVERHYGEEGVKLIERLL